MRTFDKIMARLRDGDHVTTKELESVVSQMDAAIEVLAPMRYEAYSLVLRDLRMMRDRCQDYLTARRRK